MFRCVQYTAYAQNADMPHHVHHVVHLTLTWHVRIQGMLHMDGSGNDSCHSNVHCDQYLLFGAACATAHTYCSNV
jgi:hypothetical protein